MHYYFRLTSFCYSDLSPQRAMSFSFLVTLALSNLMHSLQLLLMLLLNCAMMSPFVVGSNAFCTLTILQETFWREVCNEQLLWYWPRRKDLARLQSVQRRPAWKISKSSTESNVLRHVGWQRDRCKDLQEFRTASQTGMRRPADFTTESARHRHTEYSQVHFIFIGL